MRRNFVLLLMACMVLLTTCSPGGGNVQQTSTGASGIVDRKGLLTGEGYIDCPGSANTTVASPHQGTVTLNVYGGVSSPAEDRLTARIMAQFTRLHPQIKVNWVPIFSDYTTKMNSLDDQHFPDVFFLSWDLSPTYISAGRLLNLSPYVAHDGVKTSDYYPALFTPFSCKSGQIYGIPKDWGSLGVFYNKQMFKAAGIPFPSSNWTWDQMRSIARKLTKLGPTPDKSTYGIMLPDDSSRWLAFLFANGGSVLNKGGTQSAFNGQAGVAALNYYTSFQLQDHSSTTPSTFGVRYPYEAFAKKQTAMVVEGGWAIEYMQENHSDVDYAVAPLPVAPNGQRGDLIFTNAWAASAHTRYPEESWELVKYLTSASVQRQVLESGLAMPSLTSLANDPYFVSHPDLKVLSEAAPYGHADNYGPQDFFIHRRLDLAISNVLLGQDNAHSALSNAAQQIDKALST